MNLDTLTVARFAHNFNLGGSAEGLTSVSQISGDGQFAIFSSTFRAFKNLDGTSMSTHGFGSTNDPLNCDPTQPTTSNTGCRTDVLLIDLLGGSN
jgi:uncharacterized membrane protein